MSDTFEYPAFEEPDQPQTGRRLPDPVPVVHPGDMQWEIPTSSEPGPGPAVTPPTWATPAATSQATVTSAVPAIPAFSYGEPPPPPGPPPRRAHRGAAAMAAALLVTAVMAFLVGGALQSRSNPSAVGVDRPSTPFVGGGNSSSPSESPSSPSSPSAGEGSSPPAGSSATTSAMYKGVVDIDTELGFQGARAAGTGMVLTSSGEVLTNNHVVDGSTKISVTAVDTGRTYKAHVVGTDPTDDVAVIQLEGASKLSTVTTTSSANVKVGDPVVAVGNAGGRGGIPSSVEGNVVALGQSITASDESGANAENLSDLIQVDAPIESGDSGGPLFDDSAKVIGMDSAAEVGGSRLRATTAAGYAIPIDNALSIVHKIESGKSTDTIHIGLPAFLGVQIARGNAGSGDGAPVADVESGTPADAIGLAAGDTITSVDSQPVGSAGDLTGLLGKAHPGDKVDIGWVDDAGSSHSAQATLATGPAD